MLSFLFPRLTQREGRGAALFAAVTAKARGRHWYVEGSVPDTIDGRFRVLATIAALVTVRLEQLGAEGDEASIALTERFIEVMESEHRELGLGDPNLGRTVRRLVASLGRRVELWRSAVAGRSEWQSAAAESMYKSADDPGAAEHSAEALRNLWKQLEQKETGELLEGRLE
jgi:cytochrome b pre-mRNA-processing protein 3